MLTRLKDKLAESGYFKNKTVFFDSFRGFTAQEFGIIGKYSLKRTMSVSR